MEQQEPIIIPGGNPGVAVEEPQQETHFPEMVNEVKESLLELFEQFRESDSYARLEKGAETVKEYIKNNPAQAMLYSLGAGTLLGLLMRRRH